MKLYHMTCRSVGVIMRVQFFGGEEHRYLKIWEGKKCPKFSMLCDNFWI